MHLNVLIIVKIYAVWDQIVYKKIVYKKTVKSLDQPTLLSYHFRTESNINLRFFANDHKYSQDI